MISFLPEVLNSINWASVVLAFALCLILYASVQWAQMPPGPIGLPYLGYYPFFSNDSVHKQLKEMTKKYGDVFSFTVTGQMYIHLGSFKVLREALITKSDCFTRRSPNYNLLMHSLPKGIIYESGEAWKVLRRFFSQKLKEYGMGKQSQEAWLTDSLQRTIDALKNSAGQDFDLLKFFSENSTAAMSQLLFGSTKTYDHDIKCFVENFKILIEAAQGRKILLAGPLLKYLLVYCMKSLKDLRKAKVEMDFILRKIYREHAKEFDKDNVRNIVDCYLDEKRILEEKGDDRSKIYSEEAFIDTILQILGDGALTIGAVAATVVKFVADHPDVQTKLQAEVDEVVGRERFPTWEERNRMPYTNAVIYETFRASDFFPFFPSLECTEETTVGGCRVPKGSILLMNFYSALTDSRVYDQPEKFDPTRYLPSEDNKIKAELPCIFGMGKRSCLGEALSYMETFLLMTTVAQNFNILPPSSKEYKSLSSGEWTIVTRAIPRKP